MRAIDTGTAAVVDTGAAADALIGAARTAFAEWTALLAGKLH